MGIYVPYSSANRLFRNDISSSSSSSSSPSVAIKWGDCVGGGGVQPPSNPWVVKANGEQRYSVASPSPLSPPSYYISPKDIRSSFFKDTGKNDYYSIQSIIDDVSNETQWEEPEWGFPKGRRNYQEKDYETAIREFSEETGYENKHLKNIQNIMPFEEILIGSNYKSYKNKYYLMYINYSDTIRTNLYETNEISKIEWKNYEECLHSIRSYNLEKKRLIINIHHCLSNYNLFM